VTKLAPPPLRKPRGQALGAGAEIGSAIAGAVIEKILSSEGRITWQLDQLRGLKHPNDIAPTPLAPFKDGPRIKLDDWPYVGGEFTVPKTAAWFSVDWQYNGSSLGNIAISNIGTENSLGFNHLSVEAKIMDDNIVYPPASMTYPVRYAD